MRQTFDKSVPIDEQRLRVLQSKSKRNQGKKHGTGKRSAAIKRRKKSATAHKQRVYNDRQARLKENARAYWSGDPASTGLNGR